MIITKLNWFEMGKGKNDKGGFWQAPLNDGEVPANLRVHEHDNYGGGFWEVLNNMNGTPCLWMKEAGADAKLVKVCISHEEARQEAQRLHDEWMDKS
jgi:hypothetical protein